MAHKNNDSSNNNNSKQTSALKFVMISNARENAKRRAPNNINNRIEMTAAQISQ